MPSDSTRSMPLKGTFLKDDKSSCREDVRQGQAAIFDRDVPHRLLAPQPEITVLGVKYLHLRLDDGSELYITKDGLRFTRHLLPDNHWSDTAWRDGNRERLLGSSDVFRVTTKAVNGRSLDLVFKWNRMGKDVPGETAAGGGLEGAEFNSPFMEFSLVYEMRDTQSTSLSRLRTHRPLAIYVPNRFHPPERLGRTKERMQSIERTHEGVSLDWNRTYAVIYEWLKGIDTDQAYGKGLIDRRQMIALYEQSNRDLRANGFLIRDNKPRHVIVRPRNGGLARDKSGSILYGLVDFELLERTPEREEIVRAAKRHDYLVRQAKRFGAEGQLPPGLWRVTIMGVDYIYGEVESTGGALWVVGRDPQLFDYFLPEKWRQTPREKIDVTERWYKIVTKDNVQIVWRESRVGQRPDVDPLICGGRQALAYGYNSPFEEFSIAMELMRAKIGTKYPRAIYMTGPRPDHDPEDRSRYTSHAGLKTPEGTPILQENREYITIWGYWTGPDYMLAVKDEAIYQGQDALTTYLQGDLTHGAYLKLMKYMKERLIKAGFEDLSLCGCHLLLSFDKFHRLAKDDKGMPLVRIRNFELLKRVAHQR